MAESVNAAVRQRNLTTPDPRMPMIGLDAPGRMMAQHVPEADVARFLGTQAPFADLAPEAVAAAVATAGDVTVLLDARGVVLDVAYGSEELAREWGARWVGRPWAEAAAEDSRPKVEGLLRDAAAGEAPRWRHVNHPSAQGQDVPVQYVAVRLDGDGRVLASGRDLRAISALQQRLVAAQQSVERDYARLRNMEMRYRLLFQATPEAILIVDAPTLKIAEANPAAASLLGETAERLVGRTLLEAFDAQGAEAVQTLLAAVRATGRADEAAAGAATADRRFRVAASLFRHDGASLFLIRLAPPEEAGGGPARAKGGLGALAEKLPDALVVTDPDGRVLEANHAFLDLAQLATAEQARGEPLERWLGRPGVDMGVLSANLRQHGVVRLYATTLKGEFGATLDVEVSAASTADEAGARFGFVVRNVTRRISAEGRKPELPRSVEQLKELVGRVPLKTLVRETTDVVEQLCIEAALELTGDNRASAAEILGLSRQSLYVKLRRYGLGDVSEDDED